MADLKSHKLIVLKGCLFLLMGCIAGTLVVLEHPTVKLALLLTVAIWSFCRFYYFAFYVIEHYVDPSYKFAGLLSFARYWMSRRSRAK